MRKNLQKGIRAAVGIMLAATLILTGCEDAGEESISQDEKETTVGWETIPEGASAAELTQTQEEEEETILDETEESSEVEEEEGDGEEEENEENEEAAEVEEEVVIEGIDGTMTGTEEAQALVTEFMTTWGLNSSNFSVAYQNISTGEVFYYNELKQWDACSTYKFPLNLLYYDMEMAGEITGDTIIPGTSTTLAECHYQSLQYSNNELSEAMVDNLGNYVTMKQNMLKYFTLTDSEIDSSYYNHNYFCARMMMDCSRYLYDNQTLYPDALGYLEAAQPGEYFKTYITDCTIAQKYGLRDGYNHCAGIVFSSTPFVLSIYSYNAGANEMIGRLAELFYNYTNG